MAPIEEGQAATVTWTAHEAPPALGESELAIDELGGEVVLYNKYDKTVRAHQSGESINLKDLGCGSICINDVDVIIKFLNEFKRKIAKKKRTKKKR